MNCYCVLQRMYSATRSKRSTLQELGQINDWLNYIEITLLSISGKNLAWILMNILVASIAEEIFPEIYMTLEQI